MTMMVLRRRILAIFLISAASVLPADAETSTYTELRLGDCAVERTVEEGGGTDLRCEGLSGEPVFVSDFDARVDIDFGVPNQVFDTFVPFNSVGERIEWRLGDNGRPFAAIVRFKLQDSADGRSTRVILAVLKIGTPDRNGCPVAYIDAHLNRDANEMARQIADAFARPFRCGSDRATYVGSTDKHSGSATATHKR